MKSLLRVLLLLTLTSSLLFGQLPETCGTPIPEGASGSSRHSVLQRTSAARSSSFLAPVGGYTRFTFGNETRFGPAFSLQYTLFRSPTEGIDFFGGILLGYQKSGPVDLSEYTPLGIRSRYDRTQTRSFLDDFRLGMGFLGVEYTVYLTDGDVRPYAGMGGMFMLVPYQGSLMGTVAPTVKGGLQVHLRSGFSGFAELRHVFGLPNIIGPASPHLRGMTGAAFGFAFAPQWN